MNAMESERYALPDPFDMGRLKQDFQKRFHGIEDSRHTRELEVFDTFDWRLYARGRLLVKEGDSLILFDTRSDRELITQKASRKNDLRFWWELDDSPLRQYLRKILDMRALVRLVRLKKSINTVSLLNTEEKTVVRVAFELVAAAEKKASSRPLQVCKLIPVRGYPKQLKAAGMILSSAGFTAEAENLLIAALEENRLQPGGYSSKINIPLRPEISAGEASRLILAHIVQSMRLNEPGIRKDIDSEFLHDFRVAVRRARSLLTLMKGVFDPDVNRSLKVDLQTVGKATNRLRDLDVYLLQQRRYEDRIPERLRSGITPLFTSLRRRRSRERTKTVRFLGSADYRRIIARLEAVSRIDTDPGQSKTDYAGQPIKPLASRVIYRRYRKIIKAGKRIGESTPDNDLHRLRIECKKLRYALEFFQTLYPADDMKRLIKQLRSLQDNLGRFNDLSVQQDFLQAFLKTIDGHKPNAVELAAATGALINRLHLEHRQVRDAFRGVFGKFNFPNNHQLYRRLFASQENPS